MIDFLLTFLPPALLVGLALALYRSSGRQRVAVLLTFALPGAGHLFLRDRQRSALFGGAIGVLFVGGLLLSGFRGIHFERHALWAYAQAPLGVPTFAVALLTRGLELAASDARHQIGCLYLACAGLMNVVCACDAWDRAKTKPERPSA